MNRPPPLAAVLLLLSMTGCTKQDPRAPLPGARTTTASAAAVAAGIPAYLSRLTANEIRWGVSPTRNDKVTYQPDVIVMEHGSDAIRAMASNGLTWTIDADAPGAVDIQTDRILFATSRVMGRVVKVDRTTAGLAVTLGPVEITDVIKDCDLQADQPIDIGSALVYTAADYPGATTTDEPQTTGSVEPRMRLSLASYRAPLQADGAPGLGAIPGVGPPKELVLNDFHVIPVCCGGLGITLAHDGQGVKMMATAAVELKSPKVHFALVIRGGTIYTAFVQLQGTAGFRVHFSAGTDQGISGNIKQNFFIPIDASWPILGLPVPLSVVVRQTLRVETIFTAQSGTLEATGEYGFGGEFWAGKQNGGSWHADGPTSVTTKQNLAETLDGISLGVNGLVFAYGAKVIVGIGAFGFVTGPYVGYNTVVGVNKTSSMPGALPCQSGTLNTAMRFGVGYQIPQVVTGVINVFMRALGVKPINSEGGFEKEEPLIDKTDYVPAGCKPKETP